MKRDAGRNSKKRRRGFLKFLAFALFCGAVAFAIHGAYLRLARTQPTELMMNVSLNSRTALL